MQFKVPRKLLITLALFAESFWVALMVSAVAAWYFDLSYLGYHSFDMFSSLWNSESSLVAFKILSLFAAAFDFMILVITSPLMIANYFIESNSALTNDIILFSYALFFILIVTIYPYLEKIVKEEENIDSIQRIVSHGVSDGDIENQLNQIELIISNIDTKDSYSLKASLNELSLSYKNGMIISFMSVSGRILEIILRQLHNNNNLNFKEYWTIGELHSNLLENKVYTDDNITSESVEIINSQRKNYIHISKVTPKMSISEADHVIKYILFLVWDVYIEGNIKDSDILNENGEIILPRKEW